MAGSASSAGARTLFVVSDLHLGVGKDPARPYAWHAYEDFRWHPQFVMFLDYIDENTGSQAELVLNGDSFELWQSLLKDCPILENENLGCSEADLNVRLERVIDQHGPTLAALADFASKGSNRVVFVPGNHDAGLLFPSAEARLREVIGDKPEISKTGDLVWSSPNRKVYIEHGHEIGSDVNVMAGWPKPFVESDGTTYLVRSWGEHFVQDVFDQYESAYPIVDNISDHGAGIEYLTDHLGKSGTAKGVGQFVRYFFFRTSWDQFKAGLGEDGGVPAWDLTLTRAQGADLVLALVPPGARYEEALKSAATRGELDGVMATFSDDELETLCDAQYGRSQMQGDGSVLLCTKKEGSLGAAAASGKDPADVLAEHLDKRRLELSERSGDDWDGQFDVFIYSHTHKAEGTSRPVQKALGGSWNPSVLNTGAWQRVVSESHLNDLGSTSQADLAALEHSPEDLAPCYSVVVISEDATRPPSLVFWSLDKEGWKFLDRCTIDPDIGPKVSRSVAATP